jgi:hypothetical protein
MNLTHGGLPESEAWHWSDPARCQEFGRIVFLLQSSDKRDRKTGYQDFYEFKRHFMVDEFDSFVAKLDAYRREKLLPPAVDLVDQISMEIRATGTTLESAQLNTAEEIRRREVEIEIERKRTEEFREKITKSESVEQLSLF